MWKAAVKLAATTEERVAARLEDQAAVAVEHGDEALADMLTAEAGYVRNGDVKALVTRNGNVAELMEQAQQARDRAEVLLEDHEAALDALRESRQDTDRRCADRATARERVAEISTAVWLAEGYTVTP